MSKKVLTIVGNIASGKSSAAPLLVKALKANFLDADDLFQTNDPFREDYLKDTPRWALANETWLTLKRVELFEEAVKKNGTDWLVVDSGILMSYVYTYSHLLVGNITPDEWELYEDICDRITKDAYQNLVVVKLDYSVATLMKRIEERGRDYELEYYTVKYLQQLDKGLMALDGFLSDKGVKIIRVNEEEVADFVNDKKDAEKLVEKVKKELDYKK